ncbi:hypothetical protein PHLGIDRAFT_357358 [Phlebiopsis gigantea 11061_1 CR5-6]|uniref:Uncharacterized protein n=1 Tax=Phlebiopsis gigantea (strain 11061_1 CR5-6) TaxID=745531 RepID=A0A0C3SA42_PHLG1|nr:hypothetical protein PHLGIDRAFT_357358 [Phlebiopsis gigantea 11061_1 CR5-6]
MSSAGQTVQSSPYAQPNAALSLYTQLPPFPHAAACLNPPPSYDGLMRTVDRRHTDRPIRFRPSLALSDILEVDEGLVTDINVPSPSPTDMSSSHSMMTAVSPQNTDKDVFDPHNFLVRVYRSGTRFQLTLTEKQKFIRSMRSKYRLGHRPQSVLNDGTKTGLDLLES